MTRGREAGIRENMVREGYRCEDLRKEDMWGSEGRQQKTTIVGEHYIAAVYSS